MITVCVAFIEDSEKEGASSENDDDCGDDDLEDEKGMIV